MENYESEFLTIKAPLIAIEDDGTDVAKELINTLQPYNVSDKTWDNSLLKNRLIEDKYSIKVIQSTSKFTQTSLDDQIKKTNKISSDQHSILSPFNVDSDLFPNGILSLNWFKKYHSKPFILIKLLNVPTIDEEVLSGEINELKRDLKDNIKLLIIIFVNNETDELENKLTKLRQLTGLTKSTGLIYLNHNNLEKNCSIIIQNLLPALKTMAKEFYTTIETKIKQRNKKYYSIPSSINVDTTIELTPKFLETRNLIKQGIISQFLNPTNVENSIKLLEISYSNLIEILYDNFFKFCKDFISDHDLKIYNQFRKLLDILTFHIVRNYFSLEQPIIGLKKHQAHLLNVKEACKKIDLNQWICIQYEWVGELLSLVPKSLLNIKLNKNYLMFGGGLRLKQENLEVLVNPALNILKGINYLSNVTKPSNLNYLNHLSDQQLVDKKLKLLEKAKHLFTNYNDDNLFNSNLRYINFTIGEILYKRNQYEKSLSYYEEALGSKWDSINQLTYSRLLDCYQHSSRENISRDLLVTILKLCQFKPNNDFEPISFDETTITLDSFSLFTTNVLFVDENKIKGTDKIATVYDKLIGQIEFIPKIDVDSLQKIFGDVKIKLVIDKILITFKPDDCKFQTLQFEHNDLKESTKYAKSIDNQLEFNFEVIRDNENWFKILEFQKVVEKSGYYGIKDIQIESTLTITKDSKSLKYINKETTHHHIQPFYFYKNLEDSSTIPIKLNNIFSNDIKVSPVKPNINVKLINPISSIILGEQVALKFNIELENEKLNFNKISISPRIKILGNNEDLLDSKINWQDLKDDEPLLLNDVNKKFEADLNLRIFSTSLELEQTLEKFEIIIDLKLIAEEDESLVSIYDISSYNVPIINQPFEYKVSITPKYRPNNDMPNPFILNGNHLSMPIVTRIWSGNLTLTHLEDITIKSTKYSIRSKSPEILIELLESSDTNQYFFTRSKNGISQRNVTMIISAEIEWTRNDNINTFKTRELEILLPLTDPRVLISIDSKDHDEDSRLVKLQYIIENPTPRIFQFQTKLLDENERFVWNFDNERNIFPITLNKFPVLPFTRFILEYWGNYNSIDSEIQLPQLKVFDLQYRVHLPTLPVVNNITIKENQLYWKKVL